MVSFAHSVLARAVMSSKAEHLLIWQGTGRRAAGAPTFELSQWLPW